MPKSTAETIARIRGCACRGTNWNNVAVIDDLCLMMTEVLDRLSALERERREPCPATPTPQAGKVETAEEFMRRTFRKTQPELIRETEARDAAIRADERGRAIRECLNAVHGTVIVWDSGPQTHVNACNALRSILPTTEAAGHPTQGE